MTATPSAPSVALAERRFDMADQQRFAALSGDANPMHVDGLAARRLISGRAVVHGIHLLLTALDAWARAAGDAAPAGLTAASTTR
jgi:acyl dehydratase